MIEHVDITFESDALQNSHEAPIDSLWRYAKDLCPDMQRLVVHFSGHAHYSYEGDWYMLATASGEGMEDVLLRDMGGMTTSRLEPTTWANELTWLGSRGTWNFPLDGDTGEAERLSAFLERKALQLGVQT